MILDTKFSKLFIFLFAIGFVLWLGGGIVRASIAFDIFEPGTELLLKQSYESSIQLHSVYLYVMTAFYTLVGYGLAILTSFVLFFKAKAHFKQEGWLFMAFILFFLTIPIEAYLAYCDISLGNAIILNGVRDFYHPEVQEFFMGRFKDVTTNVFSGLSFLSALSVLFVLAFRPLSKKED